MPSARERQNGILPAADFDDTPFWFIGVGTAGSKLAHLAKCMHIKIVHACDGDTVDENNPYSQSYPREAVGRPKVHALGREIFRCIGARIHMHNEFITGPYDLSGIVFLCVDTMSARRKIWENCIKGNGAVELMIDVRMDASYVAIYMVDPSNEMHQVMWEHYCHGDEESENDVGSCGSPLSCPATSLWLASEAWWQIIRWHARKQGRGIALPNRILRDMWTGREKREAW